MRLNRAMARQRVVDPQGTEWTVRRRWVHRRLRWRGPRRGALDLLDGADLIGSAGDLPVVGIVFLVIGLILIAVFAVLFIIPAVIFLIELLIVLAIVTIGVVGRMLFGRPWTVEARRDGDGAGYEWQTTGWRASNELVHAVAGQLRTTGHAGDGRPIPATGDGGATPTR